MVETSKKKFERSIEAERFIHNDLSNCAWSFSESVKQKLASNETDGIYHQMMASLVFYAFTVEAKVNFVGWKVLEDGWPERANFREKIRLIAKVLNMELDWGARPLQTLNSIRKLRDTLAHGKPEIIDEVKIVEEEPSVWDVLKSQWEFSITPEMVAMAKEDVDQFWNMLLVAAEIPITDTITHGGDMLREIIEPEK